MRLPKHLILLICCSYCLLDISAFTQTLWKRNILSLQQQNKLFHQSKPTIKSLRTLLYLSSNEDEFNSSSSKEEVMNQIISYIKTSDDDDVSSKENAENLSIEQISSMIEATFVKACLQLATGYVDVLKLFIVSVQASYNASLGLSQILDQLPEKSQTANRMLMPEEIRLRKIWVTCIYLSLSALTDSKIETIEKDKEIVKYEPVVEEVLSTIQQASDWKSVNPSSFDINSMIEKIRESSPIDTIEEAMLTNTVRVICLTFTVVQEVKNCDEEAKGVKGKRMVGGPPRPPISGTY